jgi:menaquinone-dependent protoporphyrinogen oxidase
VRVLVTCASPHGSTRGIAERVARRLRDSGLSVDCLPVEEAPAPEGYDAVVVGSALHNRAWMPEAAGFLTTYAAELAGKPVWLFSVGMPGALARPLRRPAMREGPQAVAPFVSLVRPRGTRLFSGVASRQQFPPVSRVILRLMGGHFGDFRDWADIDAWAAGIAADLRSPQRHDAVGPDPGGLAGGAA